MVECLRDFAVGAADAVIDLEQQDHLVLLFGLQCLPFVLKGIIS